MRYDLDDFGCNIQKAITRARSNTRNFGNSFENLLWFISVFGDDDDVLLSLVSGPILSIAFDQYCTHPKVVLL